MKNVNLEKISNFVSEAKTNPSLLEKEMVLEIYWNMDEEKPQMESNIFYGKGEQKFFVDQPDFLGGKSLAPSAIQYCLLGLSSCFLSTFSVICKKMNLNVNSVKVTAKMFLDMSLPLLGENKPVNKGVEFNIFVDSPEDSGKIERAKELALEYCPAVWCMKNSVPVNASVVHNNNVLNTVND